MSPFVQTLLRSLQVPEPEPELEPEPEPELEAEAVDAGALGAVVLAVVEAPAVTETASGALAGAEFAGAGLDEGWLLPSHLPPSQSCAQLRS